jgi:hypothetical protein
MPNDYINNQFIFTYIINNLLKNVYIFYLTFNKKDYSVKIKKEKIYLKNYLVNKVLIDPETKM